MLFWNGQKVGFSHFFLREKLRNLQFCRQRCQIGTLESLFPNWPSQNSTFTGYIPECEKKSLKFASKKGPFRNWTCWTAHCSRGLVLPVTSGDTCSLLPTEEGLCPLRGHLQWKQGCDHCKGGPATGEGLRPLIQVARTWIFPPEWRSTMVNVRDSVGIKIQLVWVMPCCFSCLWYWLFCQIKI